MKLFRNVSLMLCLAVVLSSSTQSGPKSKAPNFALKGLDGKIVEMKRLAGKAVVLNFWATWCGPCRAEIPGMIEVYKQYKSKGLEIVGVSLDQGGWDQVRPFAEKLKIPYPVVVGDGNLADDYGGIDAIPSTFFIDKNGYIVDRHLGYLSKSQFESMVKKLL